MIGDALRNLDQERVADRMRVVVVDVLEIVDVDEGERESRLVMRFGEQLFDVVLNQRAIRQPGQVVEIGTLRQLGLDLLAPGEIDRGGKDEIAIEKSWPGGMTSGICARRWGR